MMDISVPIPVNFEEQQKIGAFFKQLDDTIALHQRKLDLLKETKKASCKRCLFREGRRMKISHREEAEVEEQLIRVLGEGHNQWTYRPDLKSEEDLWVNLRQKNHLK